MEEFSARDCANFSKQMLLESAQSLPETFLASALSDSMIVPKERVYAYELYHQFRTKWDKSCDIKRQRLRINGELDKRHKDKAGASLRTRPDMIVHEPGADRNILVVEIKCANESHMQRYDRDYYKLRSFCDEEGLGYQSAVYIIYGVNAKMRAQRCIDRIPEADRNARIEVWVHESENAQVSRFPYHPPTD